MATRITTTPTTNTEREPSADQTKSERRHADFSFPELAQAYFDCRQAKRNTTSALAFEQNLERNLCDLYDDLKAGTYQPGRSICFVVTRPKAREVWAADFRDRIVHHLLYNRYALWRIWDASIPPAVFVMLNPSTADEVANDPTVERCERRARAMGYGGLRVCNIFAWRSTDPSVLKSLPDPVGQDNDAAIAEAVRSAGIVVCGWGTHGNLNGRGEAVRALIRDAGAIPHYLKLNSDGTPQHPLYIAYAKKPTPWEAL